MGVIFWLVLVLATFLVSLLHFFIAWPIALILALNVATFCLYGADKLFAVSKSWRVPEKILLVTAFLGGALGALIGMHVFRHKVSKKSFQFALAVVILAELAIIL